jgi:N-acetylglucosamine kinase-like BadF-type ATPase
VFLGVDGGGTKTAFCLVGSDGSLMATTRAPSSYYFSQGIDLVERVLRQGIEEICRRAQISPADIHYAFFGLPSYGEVSRDVPLLDAAPRGVLGHDRYSCNNDMVCGWAGSLGAEDGINVISGTGSMTYGERVGAGVRVGGWGELFGDEGSGYWIGVRGLTAFTKMSDGRLPVGPLHQLLREHLDLASDLDVVDTVLNRWQGGRSEIAALSNIVAKAAESGDPAAAQILLDAASELAELVDVTRRRLEFPPGATVPVSYSGGVFTSTEVLQHFREELIGGYDNYALSHPRYSPVIGAALYGAKLAGTPLDEVALNKLRSDMESESSQGDHDAHDA